MCSGVVIAQSWNMEIQTRMGEISCGTCSFEKRPILYRYIHLPTFASRDQLGLRAEDGALK